MFNIFPQFRQGIFDGLDEVPTTGGAAPEADHRIPLGLIIRDRQDLAIGAETVDGALDHLVGSLALARIKHFDF
jgi:hypothetical protein